jgi:hypothetical protein
MAFFKPPASSFLSDLRNKDRRSAKEWEYINAAGVWLELGQTALSLAREGSADDGADVMSRRLALADKALEAAREVLRMRAQYFHDIVGYGVDAARQMSFLVERGHDAVHSASHKSVRATLTPRLETEAAKMLAKTYLERASGDQARRSSSNASGGTRDGGAGGVADYELCGARAVGRQRLLGDRLCGDRRPCGQISGRQLGIQDSRSGPSDMESSTSRRSLLQQGWFCTTSPNRQRIWNLDRKIWQQDARRLSRKKPWSC